MVNMLRSLQSRWSFVTGRRDADGRPAGEQRALTEGFHRVLNVFYRLCSLWSTIIIHSRVQHVGADFMIGQRGEALTKADYRQYSRFQRECVETESLTRVQLHANLTTVPEYRRHCSGPTGELQRGRAHTHTHTLTTDRPSN